MSELDLTVEARARVPWIESPGELTPAVIATWRGRMINEHGSSYVFEQLAVQLAAIGLSDEADEVERFAAEEREHGALCGAVVDAAGGEARATALPIRELPAHPDTTPRAAALRNILSICCMSETIAVSLIGAERLEMPPGPLRELLTKIWSDEVGHARFGWRLLARIWPELTADEIDALARYLPCAFGALEDHELTNIPLNEWPDAGTAYGLCGGADARTLFFETVDEVIVPQLAALGLPAAQAWDHRRTA